jgi:hypothetical protein
LQDWSPNDSARLRSIIASLQRGVSPEDRGSGGHEVLHEDVSSRGRAVDLHTRSLEKDRNIPAIAKFSRCPSPRATPSGPSSMPPNSPASWGPFFFEIWADNGNQEPLLWLGIIRNRTSNNVVPTHEGPQLAQPRAEALLVSCAHF